MPYSLETRIKIVVLMVRFESPKVDIRELQRLGPTDVPVRQTTASIYQNFLGTSSVQDLGRIERLSTIIEDQIEKLKRF